MGQMQVPSGAPVQNFPSFQNMFSNPLQSQQTTPQLTTTDGMSQIGVNPPVSGAWGMTGTTAVPPGTTLPGTTTTQYVPPTTQSGN